MVNESESRTAFWKWVANRPDGDDPEGDFVRDTRDLIEMGIDPETRVGRMDRANFPWPVAD